MSSSKPVTTLLTLPAELQLSIWESLPDFWTVVSLRQACRALDKFYLANEDAIKRAQRNLLTAPIESWYRRMADIQPLGTKLETTTQGWTVEHLEDRTAFTREVMQFLPYFQNDWPHSLVYLCPYDYSIDWRLHDNKNDLSRGEKSVVNVYERSLRELGMISHCICLTASPGFVLDTLRAKVYWTHFDFHEKICITWTLKDFIRLQIEHVDRLSYLYLQLEWYWLDLRAITKSKIDPRLAEELFAILRPYGWPERISSLDEMSMQRVQEWWRRNGEAYNRGMYALSISPPSSNTFDTYLRKDATIQNHRNGVETLTNWPRIRAGHQKQQRDSRKTSS